jgi:hypothetical protein
MEEGRARGPVKNGIYNEINSSIQTSPFYKPERMISVLEYNYSLIRREVPTPTLPLTTVLQHRTNTASYLMLGPEQPDVDSSIPQPRFRGQRLNLRGCAAVDHLIPSWMAGFIPFRKAMEFGCV